MQAPVLQEFASREILDEIKKFHTFDEVRPTLNSLNDIRHVDPFPEIK